MEREKDQDEGGRLGRYHGDSPDEKAASSPPEDAEDGITAIPRSPESVFLYWELAGRRSAEVLRELGPDCQWVLRILDLADGTTRTIPVDRNADNYYVHIEPGRAYGFELAARAAGKWRTVCRTARVQTPVGEAPSARKETPPEGASARPPVSGPDRFRAASRGMGVPGLSYESTAAYLGSSPGRPSEEQ